MMIDWLLAHWLLLTLLTYALLGIAVHLSLLVEERETLIGALIVLAVCLCWPVTLAVTLWSQLPWSGEARRRRQIRREYDARRYARSRSQQ
jgi:hypothetical protein